MEMNIRKKLEQARAEMLALLPNSPEYPDSGYVLLGEALAEIERLEAEVRSERFQRGRERQEYDATIGAMRQQLDTMTDAALRAGITEALGD
jgi:hypothetical protein